MFFLGKLKALNFEGNYQQQLYNEEIFLKISTINNLVL